MSSGKKSRGRQKTEMRKMKNESNLQVTFSKRRSGLFKKASELCTLCGAYVALIVFSPSEKVFSFGHPNVDTIIDRYLSEVLPQNNETMQFLENHRSTILRELNAQLTVMKDALDNEKKHVNELSHLRKANEAHFWWVFPIDGMNWVQLGLFKNALDDLKKIVAHHADRFEIQGTFTQTLPFLIGNGSSSNMPLEHQPNSQQASTFPQGFFQNPMLNPHLFDFNNMGGQCGNGSSSNVPLEHQPNSQQTSIFPEQFFQNHMLEPRLFSFNNMGGEGGNGSSSNIPLEHQPNSQNPMMQPHLFGFNNMERQGGNGPSGFF